MSNTLSEAQSKQLLGEFGIPFPREELCGDVDSAVNAAASIGYPVAMKLNGEAIAHKTERGLVRLGVTDGSQAAAAAEDLLGAARPADGEVQVLVAPMVGGARELIAGLTVDEQFGPTVMVGVGGILAEAVADVAIRLVPIQRSDALEMLDQLESQSLLGPFRGEPAIDREAVASVLMALSEVGMSDHDVASVDLNPLIISDGQPVAVDALVEMGAS